MTIAQQDHTATTALLAAPALQSSPEGNFSPGQNFSAASRGYHKGDVDRWVRGALDRIAHLERRLASIAEHAVASPQGQQTIAELIRIAADEITGQQQAAAQEIEQLLAGARQQSDGILADARTQADKVISSATQQASALVASARADAKKTTDEATAHAAAVDEAAGARMAHYTRVLDDTVARMRQIHEVVGANLEAHDQRGPLQADVDKALAEVASASRNG